MDVQQESMVTLMTEYIWLGMAVISLGVALPTRRLVERALSKLEVWACERIERQMRGKPILVHGTRKALLKK